MKTAIVIGATGLVGGHLVRLLLKDPKFGKIIVFSRRSTRISNEKLVEHLINFDQPETWKDLVKGDVLFSSLGTTIKQAGSKEVQYKIDYIYQYEFAKAASENGVPAYVLVSSSGADPNSKIFYSRIKGELDRDVKKLQFKSISILQPSLLTGHREKERFGESVGFVLLKFFNAIGLLKKYKPIHGKTVATAMINAGTQAREGVQGYALEDVFRLAEV